MATLGALLVEVGANTARIKEDMGKVSSIVGGAVNKMEGLFRNLKATIGTAISIGAITALAKEAVESAHSVELASQKYGVASGLLSEMGITARIAGVDMDALGKGMKLLSRNAMDTASGTGKAKDAFRAMGIEVKDASTGQLKPMSILLMEVAEKMASYEDSTEKTALAQKTLGRSGSELIPFFNELVRSGKENVEVARDLGATWTDKTARSAAVLADDMHKLEFFAKGIGMSFVKDLAPAASVATNQFIAWARETGAAQKAGKILSETVKILGNTMYATVLIFKTAGKTIGGVAATIVALFSEGWTSAKDTWNALKVDIDKDLADFNKKWQEFQNPPEAAAPTTKKKSKAPVIVDIENTTKALEKNKAAMDKILAQQARDWEAASSAFDKFMGRGIFDPLEADLRDLEDSYWSFFKVQSDALESGAIDFDTYIARMEKARGTMDLLRSSITQTFEAQERMKGIDLAEKQAAGWNAAADAAERFLSGGTLDKGVAEIKSLDDAYYDFLKTQSDALESGAIGFDEYLERMEKARALTVDLKNISAASFGDMTKLAKLMNGEYGRLYLAQEEGVAAASLYRDAWTYAYTTTKGYMTQVGEATLETFKSMEEALTDFVMTGQLKFSDFADQVIADLLRIAIRANVVAPLFATFGLSLPVFGGGKASGGPVYAGVAYEVGEHGPETFVPGRSGTIIPNSGGGSVTVNIKNDSGYQIKAKSSQATFDAQGWVINVVLDGINRNVGGLRTALGRA